MNTTGPLGEPRDKRTAHTPNTDEMPYWYPSLTINCRSCARNRTASGSGGNYTYCNKTGRTTSGASIDHNSRADDPCMDYRPAQSSITGVILDWRIKKEEAKKKGVAK